MSVAVMWMRHGTCEDGLQRPAAHARPGSQLSVHGQREAELTARELRSSRAAFALVTSSPQDRARQTAAVVARALSTRLGEPFDTFGEWRAPDCVLGLAPHEYPAAYLDWRDRRDVEPDSALPGGESLNAFANRALDAIALAATLTAEHGPVLIVSHRLLIGAVAAVHGDLRRPADVFRSACKFRLPPAHLWQPPPKDAL